MPSGGTGIIAFVLSFIFKNYGYVKLSYYLKASGCLGLSCSIINWIALQILLDKLYFLYTVEKMVSIETAKNASILLMI